MPELPDIIIYLEHLERRVAGLVLEKIRLASPFLLRSIEPRLQDFEGKCVTGFQRLGKRIVFCFEGDLYLVLHLMIAGRLHWKERGSKLPGKAGLASFDFDRGSLTLTEAGSKRRASLYALVGKSALKEHDPGGLEVLSSTFASFGKALQRENHTLKRALTDPRLFSGIGNAYSDEILHLARLSPLRRTDQLNEGEARRLFTSTRETLEAWIERLRKDAGDDFPENVTAFRDGMAVHGRFRLPCPVCATPVQRIAYAENETNYCPTCQTDGNLLADRSLSRLLRGDWPRSLEELEELRGRGPKKS